MARTATKKQQRGKIWVESQPGQGGLHGHGLRDRRAHDRDGARGRDDRGARERASRDKPAPPPQPMP
jgi:hypothetical protein